MMCRRLPLLLLLTLAALLVLGSSDPTSGQAAAQIAQIGADEVLHINLAANDLVYDPLTQKIYASVPGSFGPTGNSITAIDPRTGLVGPPAFVGSDPGPMAITDNGQYIYV